MLSCSLAKLQSLRPIGYISRGLRGKVTNNPIPTTVVNPGPEVLESVSATKTWSEYTEEQKDWYWRGGCEEYLGTVFNRHNPEVNPKVVKKDDPKQVSPELTQHLYSEPKEGTGMTNEHPLTKSEVVSDPSVWFWVERLLPRKHSIACSADRTRMASGWIPPPITPPDKTYFVPRTRAGLFPVYKKLAIREIVHVKRLDEHVMQQKPDVLTIISRVDGQPRDLEMELLDILEKKAGKKILSAVSELQGRITFKGDHVEDVVRFLEKEGF